jgi:hypothetical protein
MLVRNGAKIYVKNPRVPHREKIRETGFMKFSSRSSSEIIQTMHVLGNCGKGIETQDFSMFTFSHWANKLRFLIERHSKLKSEIKNIQMHIEVRC